MQILATSTHDTAPTYEAPAGKLVRTCALAVAIGISLLIGAIIFALPDLAAVPVTWFLWILVTLSSVFVYTVGTVMLRRSSQRPSRRVKRWLNSESA